MTLQQILYALTIAKTGSMNKAAEKLFISQPTLTAAIKALESEINITIFILFSCFGGILLSKLYIAKYMPKIIIIKK